MMVLRYSSAPAFTAEASHLAYSLSQESQSAQASSVHCISRIPKMSAFSDCSKNSLPPGNTVDIIQLIGRPRLKQACRRIFVTILLHAREAQCDDPTTLHIRQKLCIQILRAAAEIVIRINAHHRIEETFRKRQSFRSIGFDGNDLAIGQSEGFEKNAYFRLGCSKDQQRMPRIRTPWPTMLWLFRSHCPNPTRRNLKKRPRYRQSRWQLEASPRIV